MGSKLQQYCLKWNNHQSHLSDACIQQLETEFLIDVTLCVEGRHIHAHRMVLSACSSYLQDILMSSQESHPFLILCDMKYEDVKSVVEFIYHGEVNVSADCFTSVLKAAEDLRVNGLMEVGSYWPEIESDNNKDLTLEIWDAADELPVTNETHSVDIYVDSTESTADSSLVEGELVQEPVEVLVIAEKTEPTKSRKRKKEPSKKEYTEEALAAALEDLKAGRPLLEASVAYHIPRSTLYVRARSQNISLVASRQDHSGEKIQAAVQAVTDGASLQQASELFKIPKTVLWRRVHKEVGHCSTGRRSKCKESHDLEKKQAAVLALERGENLSKVSVQYQIPRSTLFREKIRLVESGRLPWSSWRKRPSESGGYKEHRINEAVAACREGKMSQASASQRFQVPKTTIWRRLKDGKLNQSSVKDNQVEKQDVEESVGNENGSAVTQLEQGMFSLTEASPNIPVTYIDENDFTDSSLIILTTSDENGIALTEGSHLVVESETHTTCEEEGNCEAIIDCNSEVNNFATKAPEENNMNDK